MKNKIIKDALALTLITLVAGVALGGDHKRSDCQTGSAGESRGL